jgi:hypothetical protein
LNATLRAPALRHLMSEKFTPRADVGSAPALKAGADRRKRMGTLHASAGRIALASDVAVRPELNS